MGLLAGYGRLPILFAQLVRQRGYYLVGVGIKEEASPDLVPLCDEFYWASVAKVGRMIRGFKRGGIHRAVMLGKVNKARMFTPRRIFQLLPDWRTVHLWLCHARADKKDDTLLLAVVKEFERDQICFDSALDYCPELLVKRGCLTRRRPSLAQWKDIVFGWNLAKEMGRLDVGQSVAIKEQAVIAVEAMEGTDPMIHRAGQLCPAGQFVVVKVAKPQQDRRFDVPTIGTSTVQTLSEAGAGVLAVEAGQTIILDQPQVVEWANRSGIAIVALDAAQDLDTPPYLPEGTEVAV